MSRQPALFIGHGNPMNALEENEYTRAWRKLGQALNAPKAILFISAHWVTAGSKILTAPSPKTFHDIYGFPEALYTFQYPAKSALNILSDVQYLLEGQEKIYHDATRGFDHGVWSTLCHIAPNADIPVLQISIDQQLSPKQQYEIGRALKPLRERGVMIVGSGNLIHNLSLYQWGNSNARYPWAEEFENDVVNAIEEKNHTYLLELISAHKNYKQAHPTPEHLSPFYYVLGASDDTDTISYPVTGIDGGSMSMLSVKFQ